MSKAKDGRYYMYDFGNPDMGGDCFWLVAQIKGLDVTRDFPQILRAISQDLNLNIEVENANGRLSRQYVARKTNTPTKTSTATSKAKTSSSKMSDYVAKPWSEEELDWWGKYGIGYDTLGFQVSPNFDSKAVLLFDTEQSEYQHFKNYDMALRRAALDKRPPFFHSFYLTVQSRKNRMKIIRRAVDLCHQRHKGVHLVIIDGVADMIRSVNDEIESVALVEELYRMAGIYHTCIICVLHYIPNGIKLRGHIGSELRLTKMRRHCLLMTTMA